MIEKFIKMSDGVWFHSSQKYVLGYNGVVASLGMVVPGRDICCIATCNCDKNVCKEECLDSLAEKFNAAVDKSKMGEFNVASDIYSKDISENYILIPNATEYGYAKINCFFDKSTKNNVVKITSFRSAGRRATDFFYLDELLNRKKQPRIYTNADANKAQHLIGKEVEVYYINRYEKGILVAISNTVGLHEYPEFFQGVFNIEFENYDLRLLSKFSFIREIQEIQ